ncbi:S24 family peptidase [Chlorobium ferrooxidans]|uniref:Helix-turn-helix motif:Peptidase S24, S26A and S26B n=1 Tax=Chlorobium ferrooxidans DSM 13031 TaxID=377431 RepID=Q0YQW5_9CHLB|nr:S24 family peptidase [Chlorobium ferrooxidans]EAT58707.1 Helix-turn-helix motif:Peptidase S24, S26A and S26B [Chlorobium ferrooxidans DSM 13031]
MEQVCSLGTRIKSVRDHFGLRQEEFGEKIGLSGNRVSEIENDKGGTKASVLISICQEFPLNPEWLLSGEGSMLKKPEESGISPDEFSRRITLLEKQMQQFVINTIEPESPSLAKVPLYSSAVPAGMPDPASDEIEEYLDMPASWAQGKKNIYALKVNGDSMVDIGIMPGDLLMVEARTTARDGQVVVACINGEVTVKTLCISNTGTISLMPENKRYPPIAITADMDFRIQGVVMAAVRHYA